MAYLTYSSTSNSITLKVKGLDTSYQYQRNYTFLMSDARSTTAPSYDDYDASQTTQTSGSVSESNPVTFTGLQSNKNYYFRVYIYNASHSLLATIPAIGSYGYAAATTAPPSYSGSVSASAWRWLKNDSYPAQGSAKLTITTSGASSNVFRIKVAGYVKTLYSDADCETSAGTSFGNVTNLVRYIKLDNLYDNDTLSAYTVSLYGEDTMLDYSNVYHQAYQKWLSTKQTTQTSIQFNYGISSKLGDSNWRLALYNYGGTTVLKHYSIPSSTYIDKYTFSSLTPDTIYTIRLEHLESSLWISKEVLNVSTDDYYTVTIQYATTMQPSVIFETGTVAGFTEGGYFTQTHIITNMASKSSLASYSYSRCDHTLPFQVTGNTTIRAYVELKHYTITYYKNDGTSTSTTQSKIHNVAVTLKDASAFSITGYTLKKWNTEADGSGTNYALGATYNYDVDLTLYAVWQINSYNVNLYYYSREPGEDVYSHLVTITQGVIYNYQYTENLLMSILSGRGYSGYRFEDSNPTMPYNITSDSSIYIYLLHSSRTIDKFYFHRNSSSSSDVDRNYIYSGAATTNLTAAKFNELFSKIHEVERALGRTETSFTDLTGNIRAININETATAISNLTGSGSVISADKQQGGIVYASYFVGNNTTSDTSLKAALNRAIDDYNT